MSFEISGKLIEVYQIITISDKFRKREFVIEKTENKNNFDFTDYIKFQVTQDKCNLIELFSKGDLIKVSFNLRGRKWEKDGVVNYFTNLEAWKIESVSSVPEEQKQNINSSSEEFFPDKTDSSPPAEEIDDLPF